ncbi:HNH endonuclease [Sutcliffiella horikoshii]|uniref:HNH endonuclease n=1 Tax=Sutcliffiella horikoshii TaxID=79883 RepID=UPI003CEFADC9
MKKPYKPCLKAGCHNLTRDRYCPVHTHIQEERNKEYRKNEPKRENKTFYDSKEWKRARRLAIIRDRGLCVKCLARGKYTKFDVVDHRIEIKDDHSLRLELLNLQCLCHTCHNRKTQEEKKKRNK